MSYCITGPPTVLTISTANETLHTPPSLPVPVSRSTLLPHPPSAQSDPIHWRWSLREVEEVERCSRLTYATSGQFMMRRRDFLKSRNWALTLLHCYGTAILEAGEGKVEICKVVSISILVFNSYNEIVLFHCLTGSNCSRRRLFPWRQQWQQ